MIVENKIETINSKARKLILVLFFILLFMLIIFKILFDYFSLIIFFILLFIFIFIIGKLFIISNFWDIGFQNGIKVILLYFDLEKELVDAGIYFKRKLINTNDYSFLVSLPSYKFSFDSDFETGVLKIRNSIKFNEKFLNLNLDSALGEFISEYQYFSDDNCYLIIELININCDRKFYFNSVLDMKKEIKKNENYRYSFIIDKRLSVPFSSILLNGQTGAGKTYFLYNIIIQLLWTNSMVYIIDPKNSSLAQIGKLMNRKYSATYAEDIYRVIKDFRNLMEIRKKEISYKLKEGLDLNYFDFDYDAAYLIIDEFATVKGFLDMESSDVKKQVWADINAIVTQGRSLGFFVCFCLQKTDSNILSLLIRDNLPLKIVMGSSDFTTYLTAFGTEFDLKGKQVKTGEGFYKGIGMIEPRKMYAPELNFDIYKLCKKLIDINKYK